MQRTPQQQFYIEALTSSDASLTLNALAGTGKTSTLVEGAREHKVNTLACAFNKRIADELEERMPPHVLCRTLNSIGHRAWAFQTGKRLVLKSSKLFDLARDMGLLAQGQSSAERAEAEATIDLARMARSAALSADASRDEWSTLAEHHDLEEASVDKARALLRRSIAAAWAGQVDFDDQLYMPSMNNGPLPVHPLVLVDEAQDISTIQHKMLAAMARERIVICGDPHQAIYAWRGARADSMEALSAQFHTEQLPLSVSFRCPKAVIAEAQRFVPEIEAHESAPEGVVERIPSFTHTGALLRPEPGSVVLCRTNAPLVALAFSFLAQGIGCSIQGRDLTAGLKRLIQLSGAYDIPALTRNFALRRDTEIPMLIERGKRGKAALLEDKLSCIEAIIRAAKPPTIQALLDHIARMFDNPAQSVVLSTIHRAKGLEWPTVYFYRSSLIPHYLCTRSWELEQEQNLAYVAVTRAKQKLIYVEE